MNKLYGIFTVVSVLLLIGCSSSKESGGDYSFNFDKYEVEVANPKVAIYQIRVGQEIYPETRVYIHNSRDSYYFIVGTFNETGKNSYVYKKKEYLDNFENLYRKKKSTISTFEEAMDQAVSNYIQDNLLPAKKK